MRFSILEVQLDSRESRGTTNHKTIEVVLAILNNLSKQETLTFFSRTISLMKNQITELIRSFQIMTL